MNKCCLFSLFLPASSFHLLSCQNFYWISVADEREAPNEICFRLQTKKGYKHKMFWATNKEGLQKKRGMIEKEKIFLLR
jgi:hypothetical protein